MIGLRQIEDEHQNTYVHPDQAAQEIELVRELVRQAGTVQALARRWAPERRRKKGSISARTIERFRDGEPVSDQHYRILVRIAENTSWKMLKQPKSGFDPLRLPKLSYVAMFKQALRDGQRICAMADCTESARPRSPYCSDACRQAAWKQGKKAARATRTQDKPA